MEQGIWTDQRETVAIRKTSKRWTPGFQLLQAVFWSFLRSGIQTEIIKLTRLRIQILQVFIYAILCTSSIHPEEIRLTAINCFSCNQDGKFDRINYWNTKAEGFSADLFVIGGGLGAPFLNAEADRSIDLVLSKSEYLFTVHADGGSDFPYFGINLYFGGNVKPAISAYAPLRRSLDHVPVFKADEQDTYNGTSDLQSGFIEKGAGTLSTKMNNLQITLTEFWWAEKNLYKQDLVGKFDLGSDGSFESVAQFKIQVEDVSEKFIRGDANADGSVDVTDAVVTFFVLFFGLGEIACKDGADSNDNGAVDISDGIFTLTYKFLGGVTIPSPGSDSCGPDPTEDSLDCEIRTMCQ